MPGYPTYAQGQGAPYAPYPPQYQPYPPYYPYGPYGYPPMQPRRAPGETYALVVSWIVTVIGALSIILSLLILGISALALYGGSNNLTTLGLAVSFGLAPLVGGVTAMVLGIQGILRRPSHRFTMPSYWFLLALALLALGAGIALWNLYPLARKRAGRLAARRHVGRVACAGDSRADDPTPWRSFDAAACR